MLGPVYVGLKRFIHGWIKIHYAGKIHHDIDSTFELFEMLRLYTAQWLVQIAFNNLHFLAHDSVSDPFNDSAKRRRLQNFGIKAMLAGDVFLATNLNHEVLQFRKSVEHHCEQNFTDEAGATEK